jgi:Flp pilus assembly protein TadG
MRQDGQTMVEFVIVLPILVMLLLGICQFGLVFHNYLSITDATRVGARAAAVKQKDDEACPAATAAIKPMVSAKQWTEIESRITCTLLTVDGEPAVKLEVKYPYRIGLPGFSTPPGYLEASATERRE